MTIDSHSSIKPSLLKFVIVNPFWRDLFLFDQDVAAGLDHGRRPADKDIHLRAFCYLVADEVGDPSLGAGPLVLQSGAGEHRDEAEVVEPFFERRHLVMEQEINRPTVAKEEGERSAVIFFGSFVEHGADRGQSGAGSNQQGLARRIPQVKITKRPAHDQFVTFL